MDQPEGQDPADERPAFPYHVLWAGHGNANVTLKDLLEHEEEHRIFGELAVFAEVEAPFISEDDVRAIAFRYERSDEHSHQFWLICCYYLAPHQAEAFGLDPAEAHRVLTEASHAARKLEAALQNVAPKVMAALYYVRPTIIDLHDLKGPDFWKLQEEAGDFAKVAEAVSTDLRTA